MTSFQRCCDHPGRRRICVLAVLAVLMMLMTAVTPVTSGDSDATSSDGWKCTVTIDGNDITTKYSKNGSPLTETTNVDGTAGSDGSWGFDKDTGYGPFGSFYAAFDPNDNNKMVCHLDPYDLKQTLDGKTSVEIDGKTVKISDCNKMWCLPKHYVSVDGNTLTISSSSSDGEVAKSFVIEGKEYNYLAIGVYEATLDTGTNKLGSMSGESGITPLNNTTLDKFREYAGYDIDGGISLLWNYHIMQTYRQCALAVMGDVDSQATIGYGNVDGSGPTTTGMKDAMGPYFGTASADSIGAKCFIDDAWGSLWEYVDDVAWTSTGIDAGQNRTPGTSATSTYMTSISLAKFRGWGTNPSTALDSWGLPTKSAGSNGVTAESGDSNSATAPDYYYTDNTGSGLAFGAYNRDGANAGISYLIMTDVKDSPNNGTRLAFLFTDDAAATVVTYDHSDLRALLKKHGYSEDPVDELEKKATGKETYHYLGEVAEFEHVGWIVDGEEYPADCKFAKTEDHVAKSVWVGLPAVTYKHDLLVELSGDSYSVMGLPNGLEIDGHERYEQLPSRDGYSHVKWRIVTEDGEEVEVDPTDEFVMLKSHTAISLWTPVPTVTLDHSNLTDIVGKTARGVSDLETSMAIEGNSHYPQLPNTAGYRHIGWDIDGKIVGPTAALESQSTHDAKSLWEKILVIPISAEDEEETIEVIVEEGSEPWLGKNGKTVLLTAIIVAIIAELAVLGISRKE